MVVWVWVPHGVWLQVTACRSIELVLKLKRAPKTSYATFSFGPYDCPELSIAEGGWMQWEAVQTQLVQPVLLTTFSPDLLCVPSINHQSLDHFPRTPRILHWVHHPSFPKA